MNTPTPLEEFRDGKSMHYEREVLKRLPYLEVSTCVLVTHSGGVGIRSEPDYPGERTGESIAPNTILPCSDKKQINYKGHRIIFYQLADNRGWIHNYNPSKPLALDAVQEMPITMKGYLEKKGRHNTFLWKPRWCVLKGRIMKYYDDKELTNFKGEIQICNARIQSSTELEFEIETVTRTHFFRASQIESKLQWVATLCTISKLPKPCAVSNVLFNVKVTHIRCISIRKEAKYPGERTRESICPGTILPCSEEKKIEFNGNFIHFYRLADNRGWIHNYNSLNPTAIGAVQKLSIVMKGLLEKNVQHNTSIWKSRWCVLEGCDMIYYDDKNLTNFKGRIHIFNTLIHEDKSKKKMEFQIETPQQIHYFRASNWKGKNEWLSALLVLAKIGKNSNFCFALNPVEVKSWRVIWKSGLRIRNEPSSTAKTLGILLYYTVIKGKEKNGWVQHSKGWSMISKDNIVFLRPEVNSGMCKSTTFSSYGSNSCGVNNFSEPYSDQNQRRFSNPESDPIVSLSWRVVSNDGIQIQDQPSFKGKVLGALVYGEVITGKEKNGWVHHQKGYSIISKNKKIFLQSHEFSSSVIPTWHIISNRLEILDQPSPKAKLLGELSYGSFIVGKKENGWVNHKQGWSMIFKNGQICLRPVAKSRTISFEFEKKIGIKCRGNQIWKIIPGSQAEQKGVKIGWIVRSINGKAMPARNTIIKKTIIQAKNQLIPILIVFSLENSTSRNICTENITYESTSTNIITTTVTTTSIMLTVNKTSEHINSYKTHQKLLELDIKAIAQKEWVRDVHRSYCGNKRCALPFSITNRRHHCRHCGEIFCHQCTNQEVLLNFVDGKKVGKVCLMCFNSIHTKHIISKYQLKTSDTAWNLKEKWITNQDCKGISFFLINTTTLTDLDLSNNSIRNEGALALANALRKNSTIKKLNLADNIIKEIEGLAETLKINSTIIYLNVLGNPIGDSGTKELSDALKQHIIINNKNGIGIRATPLYPGVRLGGKVKNGEVLMYTSKFHSSYMRKKITFYKLSDQRGWIHNFIPSNPDALNGAIATTSNLTDLELSDTQTSDIGVQALGEALKKNSTLITLNLWENQIGDNGAHEFSEGLQKNSTLSFLSLPDNLIGDIGAIAIGRALRENSSVISLNLWQNKIGNDGAEGLSDALKNNLTLTDLKLCNNQIGDIGACALGESLKYNSSLKKLSLSWNQISDDGAQSILEFLKLNSALISLDMRWNQISDVTINSIRSSLRDNKILQTLLLNGNAFTDKGRKLLNNDNKTTTIYI